MPKGPRRLAIDFGAHGLTHFGGVYLLHRFLTRMGFKAAVAKEVAFAQRRQFSLWYFIAALLVLLAVQNLVFAKARQITMEHFLRAAKDTTPSVTEEMERDYEKIAQTMKQEAMRIGFRPSRPA